MKTASKRRPAKSPVNKKQPLNPREDPLARDSRGKANREEIRTRTPLVAAPRQTRRVGLHDKKQPRSPAGGRPRPMA